MFKYSWLVNAVCIVGIVGCMVVAPRENTVTVPPTATGPHHAGPNSLNREDSEKRQAFCYAEVLKVVKAAKGVVDSDLPAVKAMWFDCMNQNGGVI